MAKYKQARGNHLKTKEQYESQVGIKTNTALVFIYEDSKRFLAHIDYKMGVHHVECTLQGS